MWNVRTDAGGSVDRNDAAALQVADALVPGVQRLVTRHVLNCEQRRAGQTFERVLSSFSLRERLVVLARDKPEIHSCRCSLVRSVHFLSAVLVVSVSSGHLDQFCT